MGRAELLPGTLDLLILKAVSLKPEHGYGVLLRIEQITGGALLVEQGALYPALYRLEQQGLLDTEWGTSDNNRKAKFYSLTTAGPEAAEDRDRAMVGQCRCRECRPQGAGGVRCAGFDSFWRRLVRRSRRRASDGRRALVSHRIARLGSHVAPRPVARRSDPPGTHRVRVDSKKYKDEGRASLGCG